jgi:hypothetical protein
LAAEPKVTGNCGTFQSGFKATESRPNWQDKSSAASKVWDSAKNLVGSLGIQMER